MFFVIGDKGFHNKTFSEGLETSAFDRLHVPSSALSNMGKYLFFQPLRPLHKFADAEVRDFGNVVRPDLAVCQ